MKKYLSKKIRDAYGDEVYLLNGKLCFKGTHIIVSVVLDLVRDGLDNEDIRKKIPTIAKRQIEIARTAVDVFEEKDEEVETPEVRKRIAEGLKEIGAGKTLTHDQFKSFMSQLKMRKCRTFGKIAVLPGGKRPVRAHPTDACFDAFIASIEGGFHAYSIPPQGVIKCGLGFKMELNPRYCAVGLPQSSILSKGILAIGVFDSGFRGEWVAIVINLGDINYGIVQGDKIYQFAVLPKIDGDFEDVTESDLSATDRGENGFGSTGS